MSKEISFRKATKDEVPFLLNLRINTMDEHLRKAKISLTKEQHLARIYEFFNDSYLILYKQTPVGLLKLGVKNKHLHIRQLQIQPEFQSKGIGGMVLMVVKKQAKKLQYPISLNVLHQNPAKNLYSRHGFKAISENEIEVQMQCELTHC